MRLPTQLFLLAAVSACGGRESSPPFLVDSSSDAVDSGFNVGGDQPDASSEARSTSYIPIAPTPPLEGDGRLADLNSGLGGDPIGYDACPTTTPGFRYNLPGESPAPGHGSRYLRFDSSLACDASPTCDPASGKDQIAFWFEPPLAAFQAYGLWLEAVSIGDSHPSGTLHIVAPDVICDVQAVSGEPAQPAQSLAIVPLAALELSPVWQTRCVPIQPVASVHVIDLYVDSGSFRIGLDALRLGPPCR